MGCDQDQLMTEPLGILAVVKLIQPEVLTEHRALAAAAQESPVSRTAATVVASFWTAGALLVGWLCYRAFPS
jgi:hypothetical protein